MVKKNIFYLAFISLLLTACESINTLPVSCMEPADYSFPEEIRKIGIVNNTLVGDTNALSLKDSIDQIFKRSVSLTYGNKVERPFLLSGNTAESLAKALADQNYFDEVVICDSALRAKDLISEPRYLTSDEVRDLVDGLKVDAIVSLEDVNMKVVKSYGYIPETGAYVGSIDVTVAPKVCVYIPSRERPMMVINKSDSINWNDMINFLPSDERVLSEAADFAGTVPVKYMTPHWVTVYRKYFSDDTSTPLKSAAVNVRNNQWDKAYDIWKRIYDSSKKTHKKMQMAHNIALYNEIKNDFTEALKWEEKARDYSLMDKNNHIQKPQDLSGNGRYYYLLTNEYLKELKERDSKLTFLNIQMHRFNNEKK
jgi:hypothetical protein